MKRAYERTATKCGEKMAQSRTGELATYYCRGRWCVICSGIRTAIAINNYGEELRSWEAPFLVTLTIKNVSAAELRPALQRMTKDFQRVIQFAKRHHPSVKVMRSVECSYSSTRNDYHPHLHLLVERGDVAKTLISRWVIRTGASHMGQDMRPADTGSLMEIFKYSTKISTDTRDADGGKSVAPMFALDEIFSAQRGLRLISATGFSKAPVAQDEDAEDFQVVGSTMSPKRHGEPVEWTWLQRERDWLDKQTGDFLTDWTPKESMERLIKKMEDKAREAGSMPED
jgi:hypothetical protein